jgi:hypothetical protein
MFSTNHPLIPNARNYVTYKKHICIHSEDRDTTKFPNASQFEIQLPQDLENVQTLRLLDVSLPSHLPVFTLSNQNCTLWFDVDVSGSTTSKSIIIEEGSYTPEQMVNELQNKLNEAMKNTSFSVFYHEVSGKLWIGNTTSTPFTLRNDIVYDSYTQGTLSTGKSVSRDTTHWGLPSHLGFTLSRNTSSYTGVPELFANPVSSTSITPPAFYLTSSNPPFPPSGHWIQAPLPMSIEGSDIVYMELQQHNCLDETQPYMPELSSQTLKPARNNCMERSYGKVNSAFARISLSKGVLPSGDRELLPSKFYDPPAERINKFSVKFRTHNGTLVDFGGRPFSFTIECETKVPSTFVQLPRNAV